MSEEDENDAVEEGSVITATAAVQVQVEDGQCGTLLYTPVYTPNGFKPQ